MSHSSAKKMTKLKKERGLMAAQTAALNAVEAPSMYIQKSASAG
jgi:hypothetical protein